MAFTVERNVGRLVEGSIGAEMTLEDVQSFRTRMWAVIGGVTGRVVLYGDVSRAQGFAPEVERRLVEMLRHDNPKVERSALYWGANDSPFARQAARMVAQANEAAAETGRSVDRRGFSDPAEAERWLGEILDTAERARLREIIGRP